MSFREACRTITEQLAQVLDRLPAGEVDRLCDLLAAAKAVFVTGEGRSGLVGRCFAMRLMHLGMRAHFVSESTTPALCPGDVLVAVSGSGTTEMTQTVARLARQAGGQVAVVTMAEGSPLSALAAASLVIPAESDDDPQYGRSLFEQAALIALDAVALELQRRLGQTRQQMDARHANLE